MNSTYYNSTMDTLLTFAVSLFVALMVMYMIGEIFIFSRALSSRARWVDFLIAAIVFFMLALLELYGTRYFLP